MSNLSSRIVLRLLNYCSVLRDDGVSYSDYVKQVIYLLLFLKMVHEQAQFRCCDPACGSGFFLKTEAEKLILEHQIVKDYDVVDKFMPLWAINLLLQDMSSDERHVKAKDSLSADSGNRFDVVLMNPPFCEKSSITVLKDDGKAASNQQLIFIQHAKTMLKINGRAAVVVSDNVLFEGDEGETIRKELLHECDVHTLLRLPTGIFYDQELKANILFFDRKPTSTEPWTKKLWVYDLRTNQIYSLKTNPLCSKNLQDFIQCFNQENSQERQETIRFRAFTYENLIKRDKVNLDIVWLYNDELVDSIDNEVSELIEYIHLFKEPELVVNNCINKIRNELKELFNNLIDAKTSETKGRSLEDFTQKLFGCLDYLEFYKRNNKTATGELDVIFTVKKIPGTLFQEFSDLLPVECKNWSKRVGADEIRVFSTKMDELDSKVGIIISNNGITGDKNHTRDAKGFIRNVWHSSKKVIIVLTLEDLESIINETCNLYKLLRKKILSVKTTSDS